MSVSLKRLSILGIAAVLTVAACGSSGATTAPTTAPSAAASAPASAPASAAASMAPVSGSINVSGSSTVEPISTAVAEKLKASSPDFNYTIEGPGTGDGFKRFCAGEIDIADASRAIRQAEIDLCTAAGIEYVELKVAYDGLSVLTSTANTAVTCLSFADLYALVGPESTGFDNWSDAAALAKELGSNTTFPDAPLVITGPGEESGTFDSFVEIVITPIATEREKDATTRPDYTSSANDNVIIEGITGNSTSFGWVGLAFAEENQGEVTEIEVAKEPNGTCVGPSAETVSDGSYPISRPLFIYVNKAKAAANPAIGGYVDFYLAPGTIEEVLKTVPYVNLPATELDATRSAWQSAM